MFRETNGKTGNFWRELETIGKNQAEILELKKITTEIKNSVDGLNKDFKTDEERIGEMADRSEQIIQNELWRDKLMDNIQAMIKQKDTVRRYHKFEREWGKSTSWRNNVKFSKLITDNMPYIQQISPISNRFFKKKEKTTSSYIIVKLVKLKTKRKILNRSWLWYRQHSRRNNETDKWV